ncbi:ATP-binding protein [Sphingobium sp.]|uniref:ATP-binding protein n=1 Tax=Sphingobium sp. TaxID=1912891 RepID=UPI0028BDAD05|nr:ATP-binding protein [Sphingobium sp.]
MRASFNPSILTRIVLLVAASLLLALGAMMLVTFRGPPPHSRPITLAEATGLLRHATPPPSSWQVTRYVSDRVPDVEPGQERDWTGSLRIARMLGVDGASVFLARERPPMPFAEPGIKPPALQERAMLQGGFTLALRTTEGWRVVQARQGANARWYAITLTLMAGIFALLLLPAYWVARRITSPIRMLAEGAARERPERAEPLPLNGPPEVQAVGAAFNHMRARIADYLSERTAMLVAIAHDLRTPMTRLSFRLEQLPEGARAKAQADVEEMRVMVTDLLDFMRSGSDSTVRVRTDLSAIIETLADDLADMGQDVAMTTSTRAVVRADAGALRRCIGNIVQNAVRYGGSARIGLTIERERAVVRVEDDGPGVPPEIIDRLCEPFYRGEASRNRETGGVGLGLSIARTIADGHGGTLRFANRAEGGLQVTMSLPLER